MNICSINVDVPPSKYQSLNSSWKSHDSNKIYCRYQSTWSNRTSFFVASFIVVFLTEVSSFHPATVRIIFLNFMGRVRIIRRQEKEQWRIKRGGQITNRIFRGNRDCSWEHIWGIAGSFMQVGSFTNGNVGYIQIWATKIIFKGIIESVINCPVVELSGLNILDCTFL